jgi:hypothetical protein
MLAVVDAERPVERVLSEHRPGGIMAVPSSKVSETIVGRPWQRQEQAAPRSRRRPPETYDLPPLPDTADPLPLHTRSHKIDAPGRPSLRYTAVFWCEQAPEPRNSPAERLILSGVVRPDDELVRSTAGTESGSRAEGDGTSSLTFTMPRWPRCVSRSASVSALGSSPSASGSEPACAGRRPSGDPVDLLRSAGEVVYMIDRADLR